MVKSIREGADPINAVRRLLAYRRPGQQYQSSRGKPAANFPSVSFPHGPQ